MHAGPMHCRAHTRLEALEQSYRGLLVCSVLCFSFVACMCMSVSCIVCRFNSRVCARVCHVCMFVLYDSHSAAHTTYLYINSPLFCRHGYLRYLRCELYNPQHVPRFATILEAYLLGCGESMMVRHVSHISLSNKPHPLSLPTSHLTGWL